MAMAEQQSRNGTELPSYSVERVDGAIEIRRYAPMIVAEVTVEGDRAAAASRGFRILAGYIFGANRARAKVEMTAPVTETRAERIAMTAPVTEAETGAGAWVIRFMMPRAWTLETLPEPEDGRIALRPLPAERQAVLRFSGLATRETLEARVAELRSWAAAQGIALGEGPRFHFYDPPYRLPWNRRNEVAFALSGES